MSNVQQIIKRNAYAFMAMLFLLAAIAPTLAVPRLASAAQLQNRSIQPSSAVPSQATVVYKITFDVASSYTMRGIIVDFCDGTSGSPIIGSGNCDLPGADMVVGATIDSMEVDSSDVASSWSATTLNSGRTLSLTNNTGTAVTDGDTVTIEVSGFTNTSEVGTFYARILTYDTDAISGYNKSTPLAYKDSGGVALAITQAIGVTATVQESLVFCVTGATGIDDNCDNAGSLASPDITLGTGTPPVLRTSAEDTANVYYQVSTNAALGVVVRMKGATAGLMSGSNEIPALGDAATTFGSSDEGFGMRTDSIAGDEGTLSAVAPYNGAANNYAMNDNGTSGVNSTYGDIIAQSVGPVLNQNAALEFAAKANNTTPAGVYTASFSLIASGTY